MPRDAHFTPDWLASVLVSHVTTRDVRAVLDLAAGNGALLAMARRRWPQAKLIGFDKHAPSVTQLERQFGRAIAAVRANSIARCGADALKRLEANKRRPDLVLLNPPFSIRGGSTFRVCAQSAGTLPASLAGAFFAIACQAVRVGGSVCAVMPRSFVRSEKDRALRKWLLTFGAMDVLDIVRPRAFSGVVANTIIVRFRRLRKGGAPTLRGVTSQISKDRSILRGNVRVAEVTASDGLLARWIHTTHLRDGTAAHAIARVPTRARRFRGPCVLLPRVGNSPASKVVAYTSSLEFVASDCIIVVDCRTRSAAIALAAAIRAHWINGGDTELEGTGAKYLTLSQAQQLVGALLSELTAAVGTRRRVIENHG